MKTVLVQPQANCASESKLALIVKHLGWNLVYHGDVSQMDLKVWLSDEVQLDRSFINNRCVTITKQLVNDLHRFVFNYDVEIDPEVHDGLCIRKRLDHGTHGIVTRCPQNRQSGFCYQKLLTNSPGESWMEEFRMDIFGTEILNTRKQLEKDGSGFPLASRRNSSFDFNCGLEMFSPIELNQIHRLHRMLGMDFGSFDVIRHGDGFIYVIDATTNTAPPTISWHKNITLDQYLETSAKYFECGLSP